MKVSPSASTQSAASIDYLPSLATTALLFLAPGPIQTEPFPFEARIQLKPAECTAAQNGTLFVTRPPHSPDLVAAQFEPDQPGASEGTLRWISEEDPPTTTPWRIVTNPQPTPPLMQAARDPSTGRWDLSENDRLVLSYNYQTNYPGALLSEVHPDNLKYARPRSDYIHPLCDASGAILTRDWSVDHPHHRGIYWAWPEVDFGSERGDLHALQRVFARPTGHCSSLNGAVFAQLTAENRWLWEDHQPIVLEKSTLRAWRESQGQRWLDLEFEWTALVDGVTLARRETKLYGGLNVRLAPVADQKILTHIDPESVSPRAAWSVLTGRFGDNSTPTALAILQSPSNPEYPGDWIQYPEINWVQPTFPSAGQRFPLVTSKPLRLRYRLWIHTGQADEDAVSRQWMNYTSTPANILRD